MFPPKGGAAFPLLQLEAFLVPLIHTIYHHLSSRPRCDPRARNGEGQHLPPISPAGMTARSSSNSTSNNLQGLWKAKHSPHAPAQDTVQAIHPRSGLRRKDVVRPPLQCCWQGHACLTYPDSLNHSSHASLCLVLPARSRGRRFTFF